MRTKSTKNRMVLGMAIFAVMLFSCLLPIQTASAESSPPTPFDGRILTPNLTDDVSDWVEIAQSGKNSLIVRKNFINIYQTLTQSNKVYYNDPAFQYTAFGTTSNYMTSNVRTKINEWFNGNAPATSQADRLPSTARLRSFTMQNNAASVLGTCSTHQAVVNGFSMPGANRQSTGLDVAFALSYGESANFLSLVHFLRNEYIANRPSNAIAVKNYNKISIPVGNNYLAFAWLRSPGDVAKSAGSLESKKSPTVVAGRAFQMDILPLPGRVDYGLIYPAVWVDQGIFTLTTAKITVRHRDAATQALLEPEVVHTVPAPGNYGPYNAKTFAGYGAGTLASGSAPASGTVKANESKIITYQYTKQATQNQVIYHPNGAPGNINVVNVNTNTNYTIVSQNYTWSGRTFKGWNTQPNGSGTQYANGNVIKVNANIILYAQWSPTVM